MDMPPAIIAPPSPGAADLDPVIMLPVYPPIYIKRSDYEAWLRGEVDLSRVAKQ